MNHNYVSQLQIKMLLRYYFILIFNLIIFITTIYFSTIKILIKNLFSYSKYSACFVWFYDDVVMQIEVRRHRVDVIGMMTTRTLQPENFEMVKFERLLRDFRLDCACFRWWLIGWDPHSWLFLLKLIGHNVMISPETSELFTNARPNQRKLQSWNVSNV